MFGFYIILIILPLIAVVGLTAEIISDQKLFIEIEEKLKDDFIYTNRCEIKKIYFFDKQWFLKNNILLKAKEKNECICIVATKILVHYSQESLIELTEYMVSNNFNSYKVFRQLHKICKQKIKNREYYV